MEVSTPRLKVVCFVVVATLALLCWNAEAKTGQQGKENKANTAGTNDAAKDHDDLAEVQYEPVRKRTPGRARLVRRTASLHGLVADTNSIVTTVTMSKKRVDHERARVAAMRAADIRKAKLAAQEAQRQMFNLKSKVKGLQIAEDMLATRREAKIAVAKAERGIAMHERRLIRADYSVCEQTWDRWMHAQNRRLRDYLGSYQRGAIALESEVAHSRSMKVGLGYNIAMATRLEKHAMGQLHQHLDDEIVNAEKKRQSFTMFAVKQLAINQAKLAFILERLKLLRARLNAFRDKQDKVLQENISVSKARTIDLQEKVQTSKNAVGEGAEALTKITKSVTDTTAAQSAVENDMNGVVRAGESDQDLVDQLRKNVAGYEAQVATLLKTMSKNASELKDQLRANEKMVRMKTISISTTLTKVENLGDKFTEEKLKKISESAEKFLTSMEKRIADKKVADDFYLQKASSGNPVAVEALVGRLVERVTSSLKRRSAVVQGRGGTAMGDDALKKEDQTPDSLAFLRDKV